MAFSTACLAVHQILIVAKTTIHAGGARIWSEYNVAGQACHQLDDGLVQGSDENFSAALCCIKASKMLLHHSAAEKKPYPRLAALLILKGLVTLVASLMFDQLQSVVHENRQAIKPPTANNQSTARQAINQPGKQSTNQPTTEQGGDLTISLTSPE